jgi:pyrroline-5-carboxylate reductase
MSTTSEPVRIGVVGVGAIAAAVVDALLTGPHADGITVLLSPRSAQRAARLAERHASVHVAAGNQEVLDGSDVVLLAVLPGQVAEVCAALRFRADHVVLNLAAGWPPSVLAPVVAPAAQVCQLIPLPMIALHTGPVVLHPAHPLVERLLEGCGDVIVLEQESEIIVLSCASATMSSYFAFHNTVVDWATSKGLPEATAHEYMAALIGGLALEAGGTSLDERAALPVEHETPGGLNEQVRRALTGIGAFSEIVTQLDGMHRDRMQTRTA